MKTDNWNAKLYDNKHAFISKYGEDLIELLAPKEKEHILDIGCGTGDLTSKIHHLGANINGIDKSANMIAQAREKYPHIDFAVEDITALQYNNEFDGIISNATLHWIKTPEKALHSIFNSLKIGGRFVAEFGGQNNVQAITTEIKNQFEYLELDYKEELFPWYFPSIGEYATLMEKVGFRVIYATHFDRPTELEGDDGLRNWLNMFCNTMFVDLDAERIDVIVTNVEKNLREKLFKDNKWIADYKRIRVIGTR